MGRRTVRREPLGTIWEIPDELWERIEPILLEDAPPPPKEHGGRPRIDLRAAFNGIIFRLRSGCQWNRLPKQFGDDSSIHRWFQRWCRHGVFAKIWAALVEECDDLGAVAWKWQAADGREMNVVEMKMDHVESIGLARDELDEPDVVRQRIPAVRLVPERPSAAGDQPGRGFGVSAGEQGHVMALPDQFLGQVGNNPLRSAVELRRNAFEERGNLCNPHGSVPLVATVWRFSRLACCSL